MESNSNKNYIYLPQPYILSSQQGAVHLGGVIMAKVINVNGYLVSIEEKQVTMKPMFDKHGESYTFILKQIVKDDNQKMILATMEWMAQDVAHIKWATSKDAKGQLIYQLPCVSWVLPVARNTRATWVTDSGSQNVRHEVRNAIIAYFKAAKGQDDPKKPEPPKPEKKADSKDAAADYAQQLLAQAMTATSEVKEESKEADPPTGNYSTLPTVYLYTDGACSGNPGPGGWGAMLRMGSYEKEFSGAEEYSTNNRMELMGAIEGLKALKRPCHVILISDSSYLVKGITEWMDKWIDQGWKNSQGKDVANVELWKQLDELTQTHEVEAFWIKGHNGHPENERCDALAVAAREAIAIQQEEETVYEDGTSDDLLGSDESI